MQPEKRQNESKFMEKVEILCNERGTKFTDVAKELKINTSTVYKWIDGTTPKANHLQVFAEYFDVSIDYFFDDEDISVQPKDVLSKTFFRTMKSLPQRWASLQRGGGISDDNLSRIAKYAHCGIQFLLSEQLVYKPNGAYDLMCLFDTETLHLILDIMDRCADSEVFQRTQIQLSRIILYHLGEAGITAEMISETKRIDSRKLRFLTEGDTNESSKAGKIRKLVKYGFNYSDLYAIRDIYGAEFKDKTGYELSYQYMLTGIKETPVELLKSSKELRNKFL